MRLSNQLLSQQPFPEKKSKKQAPEELARAGVEKSEEFETKEELLAVACKIPVGSSGNRDKVSCLETTSLMLSDSSLVIFSELSGFGLQVLVAAGRSTLGNCGNNPNSLCGR
ncbi:hypothetical protein U1Q18_020877 [Sarracenia purpurea var. burkii]